ncbi:MAG: DUF2752 domain-containing protein [Oscillospiraceae bacterium]|nr:DUF2752 domain-containing protein [Oscillospiraceae bacterium]
MKKILKLRPIFYFSLLIFFALLPLGAIEQHSFCPLYLMTGLKCLGCGVTRGFCAFMHFDFATAFEYNIVFTCAVFPICIFLMLEDSISLILRRLKKTKRLSFIEAGTKAVLSFLKVNKF